jgi:hypothetical protein
MPVQYSLLMFNFNPGNYKVVRHFFRSNRKLTIMSGVTLDVAQLHCRDPETSSSKCQKAVNRRRTRLYGPWFDGYTEVK